MKELASLAESVDGEGRTGAARVYIGTWPHQPVALVKGGLLAVPLLRVSS